MMITSIVLEGCNRTAGSAQETSLKTINNKHSWSKKYYLTTKDILQLIHFCSYIKTSLTNKFLYLYTNVFSIEGESPRTRKCKLIYVKN